ncbi:4Fe-4S ferredoxin iron-sulfur binding domain protein [Candidatus Malacoplasma girerdii]|uniref:4Fe-4S ferredoxin iron-sulfur binding domain protein n=1 Tax=Candidatus Malacoplasma girerdii TaxID=1318617 RepID=A0A097STI0_9BACT|nr:4Fe-4S ferredoxin iron-sulfur binding domain protein [Candidatus Malacoplasma girerdii]ASJ89409.1 MAG: ferredoxin [Candidatus Malacoplasma girerdii]
MSNKRVAIVDKTKCFGCMKCMTICPMFAITMDENTKAFVHNKRCVGCGRCIGACPVNAIKLIEIEEKI